MKIWRFSWILKKSADMTKKTRNRRFFCDIDTFFKELWETSSFISKKVPSGHFFEIPIEPHFWGSRFPVFFGHVVDPEIVSLGRSRLKRVLGPKLAKTDPQSREPRDPGSSGVRGSSNKCIFRLVSQFRGFARFRDGPDLNRVWIWRYRS